MPTSHRWFICIAEMLQNDCKPVDFPLFLTPPRLLRAARFSSLPFLIHPAYEYQVELGLYRSFSIKLHRTVTSTKLTNFYIN